MVVVVVFAAINFIRVRFRRRNTTTRDVGRRVGAELEGQARRGEADGKRSLEFFAFLLQLALTARLSVSYARLSTGPVKLHSGRTVRTGRLAAPCTPEADDQGAFNTRYDRAAKSEAHRQARAVGYSLSVVMVLLMMSPWQRTCFSKAYKHHVVG